MYTYFKQLLSSLFSVILLSSSASANCYKEMAEILADDPYAQIWGQKLAKKYGEKKDAAHLKSILESPVKFFDDMRERFKAQKLVTPEDPLLFDYFDMMKVELEAMAAGLIEEKKIIHNRIAIISNDEIAPKKKKKLISDFNVGIEYLNALEKEVAEYLGQEAISYRRSIELSYFYSRATGYFDRMDMKLMTRVLLFVEEFIQGYKKFSIEKEFEMYQQRDFSWQRRRSHFVDAFNWGTDYFVKAFENKEELEFILMPTHAHLGIDIFHRLMPTNVHLIGLTTNPIGADGFFRPGGLFWIHDVRHSVLIHMRMQAYLRKNNVGKEAYIELVRKIEYWHLKIDEESRKIEDEVLRKVTRRLIFNIYHDRGHPIVPSSIKAIKHHYSMDALFHLLQETGHGIGMIRESHRRIPEALEWINRFWEPFVDQEREILAREPIPAGNPTPLLMQQELRYE